MRHALYRALCGLGSKPGKAGNAMLYLAAGLQRASELESISLEEWNTFSVSDTEVDAGLEADEQRFFSRFLGPRDRVLLVGCGGGRDLVALCRMGHHVSGIDHSPAAIEAARSHLERRGLKATLSVGAVQYAAIHDPFDVVLFSLGCYSFIRGSQTRIATLSRLRAHLAPEGRMLFSYYPFESQSRIGRWLTCTSARLSGADWLPERGDIFSRHGNTTRVLRYRHDFTIGELARECAAARLRVVTDEEGVDVLRYAAAESEKA
ncbi:MAG: class I SAM-dependent methyltransferase [Vicinamibacterales bacterium]